VYLTGTVTKISRLTSQIKKFDIELEERVRVLPGQFAMLWVPGIGEIPLSFADAERRCITFIIARVGKVTAHLHNLSPESQVFIRGPYGNGFTLCRDQRCLLIGGGYGLAPLYLLAKVLASTGCNVSVLLGFRSEVFFVEQFGEVARVSLTTEDGSVGYKGVVTDLMAKELEEKKYEMVYVCGKEAMMAKVIRECARLNIPVEASLERLVRCGLGICGSCALDPTGLRVCRDGPVFSGEVLAGVTDFGKYWRDNTGGKTDILRGREQG
jgi:dihydroorotate dehydrogenase electron transfer subunit